MNANKNNVVNNVTSNKNVNDMINRLEAKFTQSNINGKLTNVKEIELSLLLDNANSVRFSGVSQEIILKMVDIIQNGEYEPYRYVPPIVEEINNKYVIISGNHRFKAHQALKKDTMLCVVVKFDTERDRSIWRQLENTEGFDGFVKNVSTHEDNIAYVSNLVTEGVIGSDRDSIQQYIVDAQLVTKKAEKSINNIVNAVLKKTGNHKSQDYVRSWDGTEKKEVVQQLQDKYEDKKFIGATFKELEDLDYDHRAMLQITDSFIEDPKRPIVVVYAVNGANKDKIEEIRDYKPSHLVKNFVDRWSAVLDLQKKGYDLNKLVSLEPLPQFGSEIKGEDNGVDEFVSRLEKKYSNKDELVKKIMKAIKDGKSTDLEDTLGKILGGEIAMATTKI
jgi:hypothetical protein